MGVVVVRVVLFAMSGSSSAITLLPTKPWKETADAEYFHGFQKNNIVFSCLHYIQFRQHGEVWWGKLHAVWKEKSNGRVMCEVQPFQYVPESQERADCEDYDELYAVIDGTVEIPAAWICPHECVLCYVPPQVEDDMLIEYTENNIGKPEYPDDKRATCGDSDDDDDDDDADFIVNGERFGFYQYAVSESSDEVVYAPPPQFVDKLMAHEQDDFIAYVKDTYVKDPTGCDEFLDNIRGIIGSDSPQKISRTFSLCLSHQYGI